MNYKPGLEHLERRDLLAAGDLLTQFGNQGVIRYSNFQAATPDDYLTGIVARADGSFLAGGQVYAGSSHLGVVVAYRSDGSLDENYGTGGKAFVRLASGHEWQESMALQPDGKLVVAGYARDSTAQSTSLVVLSRLHANGTIDKGFGRDGVVITGLGFHAGPSDMTVRPTGEILVYGAGASHLHLVQYLPDGSLDPNFGNKGSLTLAVDNVEASHLLLQDDGGVLISASAKVSTGNYEAQIYHVTAEGQLNAAFGTGGSLHWPVASNVQNNIFELPLPLAATHDGNYIVGGTLRDDNTYDFFVTQFTPTGEIVDQFGTGGTASIPIGGKSGSAVHDVVVDNLAAITVVAYVSDGAGLALVRLNASGAIERTVRVPQQIDSREYGEAVLAGDHLLFGTTTPRRDFLPPGLLFDQDLQVVAVDVASLSLDQTFGDQGTLTTNTKDVWSNSEAIGSVELPGGQTLVAMVDGMLDSELTRSLVLARYSASGELDGDYAYAGKQTVLRFSTYAGNLDAHLVQNTSGLFIVLVNKGQLQILRLNSDGTLDATWGAAGWLTWDYAGELTYLQDVLITDAAIYVGGTVDFGARYRVGKLGLDGELQTDFGVDSFLEIPGRRAYAGSGIQLTEYGDDQIVALLANHAEDSPFNVSLVMFNTSGEISTSFGVNGHQLTELSTGGGLDRNRDVIALPDGKILVFGMRSFGGGGNVMLQRFLANGEIDNSFASAGSLVLLDRVGKQEASDVLVDSHGRIAILRTIIDELVSSTLVTRFDSDGNLDATFGDQGTQQFLFGAFSEVLTTFSLASFDDLLLAGSEVGPADSHSLVARVIGSEIVGASWHNSALAADTNADGTVTPIDALLVINYMNGNNPTALPGSRPRNAHWIDTTNDGSVTPLDALLVINYLNSVGSGEGETALSPTHPRGPAATNDFSFPSLDFSYSSLDIEAWYRKQRSLRSGGITDELGG